MTARLAIDRRTFLEGTLVTGFAAAFSIGCTSLAKTGARLKPIPLSDLKPVGQGVRHPEAVVGGLDGRAYASNADSACAIIEADGSVRQMGKAVAPNGIAMDRQHRIVIANFGLGKNLPGLIQRLDLATGSIETLAHAVDGRSLVASNFPAISADGSIYCTHTSWGPAIDKCIDPTNADGFVYRIDTNGQVKVVQDGLTAPNGCCFDRDEKHLYVAQTAGGNVVRLKRLSDGSFGAPEPYGPKLGIIPENTTIADIQQRMPVAERSRMGHTDGLGFDADGNLWVTLVFANKVVAITPNHQVIVIIDDRDGKIIGMPTNIAWGGPDLTDLYIATAGKEYLVKAKSPVPGLPLVHQV